MDASTFIFKLLLSELFLSGFMLFLGSIYGKSDLEKDYPKVASFLLLVIGIQVIIVPLTILALIWAY
jgi:hypothetical protein